MPALPCSRCPNRNSHTDAACQPLPSSAAPPTLLQNFLENRPAFRPRSMARIGIDVSGEPSVDEPAAPAPREDFAARELDKGIVSAADQSRRKREPRQRQRPEAEHDLRGNDEDDDIARRDTQSAVDPTYTITGSTTSTTADEASAQ